MKLPLFIVACASSIALSTTALASPVFTVQLGSFESEQQAVDHWRTMSGKYASQLGGLQPNISSLTLPPENVTSYRIQAGPLNAVENARDICASLQAQQDRCFVVETAMFSPSQLPSFANAADAVQEVVEEVVELPFDPERSADNIAQVEVIAPTAIDSAATHALEATANQASAEAVALSDAAAEKAEENSSFLSRLNPFSSSDEEDEVRTAVDESLNAVTPIDEQVTIASVDNEEVDRRRAELEDARKKLQEIKASEVQIPATPPAEFATPVALEAPKAVEVDTPTQVTRAMTSNENGVLGTLETTIPTRIEAPQVALNPPMLDAESTAPQVASVETNETALSTLTPPASRPAPYIPPIAPRYVPNVAPLAPQTKAPTLSTQTPAQSIEAPLIREEQPQHTLGRLSTQTSEPNYILQKGDIEVGEAIRVPVTQNTSPDPVVITAPVAPRQSLQSRYKTTPSQPSMTGNLWAEIRAFESRSAAMNYWQEFSRNTGHMRPLRMRITQPLKQVGKANLVSLRAGPFDSSTDVATFCTSVNTTQYHCGAVTNTNTSTIAPMPGANRVYALRSDAKSRRSAYEAKRGFASNEGRSRQTNGYWIQLGAYPSGEKAANAWSALQKRYAPALDGMYPHIVEPHLGSNQMPTFRLRSGPYPTHTVAKDVCERIKAKRGLCLVARQ